MARLKKAFTLLEVLISVVLLSLIVLALYSVFETMKESNTQLYEHLQKSKRFSQAIDVLYHDIANSDGNITIKRDQFVNICIESTKNSLYGLSLAKVCWVVLKKDNTLARVEGNEYTLPTTMEQNVEVDLVIKNIELFDIYHQNGKVLVVLKELNKPPSTFLIQGIYKPQPKKAIKKPKDKNSTKKGKKPNDKKRKADNNTTKG